MIYWELFITFFRIGLFTIGGGYAMIPMIQRDVIGKGWMTLSQLIDFIAVSESTPGPFAVNIATFVGVHTGGLWGGVVATFGVVLPSFLIILLIAKLFHNFSQNRFVRNALSGVRPVVLALIASAIVSIAVITLFPGIENVSQLLQGVSRVNITIIIILILLFIINRWKHPHPIALIGMAALMGIVGYGLVPMLLPI